MPALANCQLSSDGVAEPSTSGTRSARQLDRHVAGVISRGTILLERCLVFFVHDDQPQTRHRGKYRRLPAPTTTGTSSRNPLPMPTPLGIGHMAVQDGHLAEASPKALLGLRREADLGHQHDRLPTVRDDFLNRADIDFGLAAARDAVQHDRLLLLCLSADMIAPAPALILVERMILLTFGQRLGVILLANPGYVRAAETFAT